MKESMNESGNQRKNEWKIKMNELDNELIREWMN